MPEQRILLAVGKEPDRRTDEMIEAATQEVAGLNAEVIVLHVFDEETYSETAAKLNYPTGTDPDVLARRNVSVSRIAEGLEDAAVNVSVRGAVGPRSETILHQADALDADRIIVGGRKRTPVGKAIFGSTAQSVMLNAECPTTFVRA